MTAEEFSNILKKFGTIVITDETEESEITCYPSINFCGCSFNFADDGCAESRYYGGDDIYNPRKEV